MLKIRQHTIYKNSEGLDPIYRSAKARKSENVRFKRDAPNKGIGTPTHAKLGVGTVTPFNSGGSTYFIAFEALKMIARTKKSETAPRDGDIAAMNDDYNEIRFFTIQIA
jgi:hypothetical protein